MPVFYYHPVNKLSKKLAEMTNQRGFLYQNRGQLELTLQKQLSELGYYIQPTFHTIIGSLNYSIDYHIPLNPDDELDRHAIKLCKQKNPWNYIKVLNGQDMMFVIGYVSAGGNSPFAMGAAEMAQKGIIGASYIPRAS